MSKKVWKDLAELNGGARASDEFAPEVAQALAQLRASHGLSNASCQPEGNTPGALTATLARDADAFRDELHQALPGVNRRGFLQLTGSAAVFALAGCWHKDPDTIVPYAQQPEGTTLGKPVWWSSMLRSGGRAVPVLVKTYDGRPIKLEGNPDSPVNNGTVVRGALDLRTHAALLDLYDPDRQQTGPARRSGGQLAALGWDTFDAEIGKLLATARIALITGPIDGVASRRLIDEFVAAFGGRARHAAYDAFAPDVAVAARGAAFGKDQAKPAVLHLDRAAVIVALGSDLLGGGQTGLAEQVAYGDFRRLRGVGAAADMGQLIVFEPMLSQTGTLADVRVRASMGEVESVAWALAKALGGDVPAALLTRKPMLKAVDGTDPITFTAERLLAVKAAGKHSLIYVGGATHCGEASRGLHLAANLINSLLGNEGVTVETASVPASAIAPSATATLDAITAAEVVILVGVNPAISLPGAMAALATKTVIALADREDESFKIAKTAYLAPSLHGLESWGDAEPLGGVHALQQPCIHPLWDCRASEESLMVFAVAALGAQAPKTFTAEKAPADPKLVAVCSRKQLWQAVAVGVRSWHDYVRAAWLATVKTQSGAAGDDRGFWNAALAKGVVVAKAAASAATPAFTFNDGALSGIALAPQGTGVQLVISASRILRDGAGANNAWLQETPDPVSRMTWDNYLAVSPVDAETFGVPRQRYDVGSVDRNPVVTLTVGGVAMKLPVHVQEGQHPGTVECFFGWGRPAAGKVAEGAGVDGDDSVNAFKLLAADRSAWGFASVSVAPTGTQYKLACTQGHNTMDGREIVIDDELDAFRKDPGKHKREHHHALWNNGADGQPGGRLSMWQSTHIYPGRRWGMAIDLTTCTGCQACVVACSTENNVPVVGRDEVRKGREMHWIRIDRYFSSSAWDHGTPSPGPTSGETLFGAPAPEALLDIDTTHQVVICQQCGHAPCEEVCPAMATMHNEEGLNIQVYNRCIGTRYCSNNCPYKVRRFNFYEYSKYRAGPQGSGEPFDRVVKNLTAEASTSSSAELTRAPLMMMLNPAVTVRSKGVMEKCNFCVQRTRDVREAEKATGRIYDDKQVGAITTACAQTCPTGAITFGDINDPESKVNRLAAASPHGYKLLDKELNTRPSVIYLQRIRNRPVSAATAVALAAHHGPAEAGYGTDAKPAPGEGH